MKKFEKLCTEIVLIYKFSFDCILIAYDNCDSLLIFWHANAMY